MNAHKASLINAVILIVLSLWGYFAATSGNQSFTALIPTAIGVILLALNSGVKNKNKVIAHVAVVLTLVILIGLIKPLVSAISAGRTDAIIRITIMIASTIFAKVFFIKNFRDVRKERERNNLGK